MQIREWFPRTFYLILQLAQPNNAVITCCGLSSLLSISQIRINQGLLTALAERWHSDHNTFHLHIGKMTITPKDVWHILRIPILGDNVVHDSLEQGKTDALYKVFQDDTICGYKIPWCEMVDAYATLPSVLISFIRGFLCPNHRSKGLFVGWVVCWRA